ncbi:MAG: phenylacetate--CoA ligase family protein [Deferrisomatales bacterium]
MAYFDRTLETISLAELGALQDARIRALVARCYERIPHYRRLFDSVGLKPSHIKGSDDLVHIPFTEKKDLVGLYPYGQLGVPLEDVYRFAASSGTTGVPTLIGYTKKDWCETLQSQMGRIMASCDIGRGDLVYQSFGYGLFLGGACHESGTSQVGATLFPAGPGRTKAAIEWLRDMRHTVICCTPSFLGFLLGEAQAAGVDPKRDWVLRRGCHGGEVAAPAFRRKLEAQLPDGFVYHENYGTSEMGGATVAFSCPSSAPNCHLHVMADHYFLEVIDPSTGKRVGPGEPGELVFTTLTKEASPFIRWRTRDLSRLVAEPYGCPCGRVAYPLIEAIVGRSDDVLKVRGTLVFPSQIEQILSQIPGVGEGWQIVVDQDENALGELNIMAEATADHWLRPGERDRLRAEVVAHVQGRQGITPVVEICAPGSLPRYEGKAKRVVDRRRPK